MSFAVAERFAAIAGWQWINRVRAGLSDATGGGRRNASRQAMDRISPGAIPWDMEAGGGPAQPAGRSAAAGSTPWNSAGGGSWPVAVEPVGGVRVSAGADHKNANHSVHLSSTFDSWNIATVMSSRFSSNNRAPIKMWQFIFTHTSGPVPRHAVLGVGGCSITRGRGSARGLVQCRRGRTAEQREPVVDPLSGQTLMGAGPLVPSPAPRAQIEPGTEQVEKALSGALVHVEIGA